MKTSHYFHAMQTVDTILKKNKCLCQTSRISDFVSSQVRRVKKKEMEFIKLTTNKKTLLGQKEKMKAGGEE